jgi:hypothetical protein
VRSYSVNLVHRVHNNNELDMSPLKFMLLYFQILFVEIQTSQRQLIS